MLDLATGRFLTCDSRGFEAGDTNLYRALGNSFPNATDPSGLEAIRQSEPAFFGAFGVGTPWITLLPDEPRYVTNTYSNRATADEFKKQAISRTYEQLLKTAQYGAKYGKDFLDPNSRFPTSAKYRDMFSGPIYYFETLAEKIEKTPKDRIGVEQLDYYYREIVDTAKLVRILSQLDQREQVLERQRNRPTLDKARDALGDTALDLFQLVGNADEIVAGLAKLAADPAEGGDVIFKMIGKSIYEDNEDFSIRAAIVLSPGAFGKLNNVKKLSDARKVAKTASVENKLQTIATAGGQEAASAKAILEMMEKYCFSPDTPVATDDGLKPLGNVEPGTMVYAFNFSTCEWLLAEVEKRHDNLYSGMWITLVLEYDRIEVTAGHPFWVVEGDRLQQRSRSRESDRTKDLTTTFPGRWLDSDELQAGDFIASRVGPSRRIERIEKREVQDQAVCNLTICGHHNFTVGMCGLLAHNSPTWCLLLQEKLGKNVPMALKRILVKEGIDSSRLHGHHIVMKGGFSHWSKADRQFVLDAQKILHDNDILLLGTKEALKDAAKADVHNLAFAINGYKGIHSPEYAKAVLDRLNAVKHGGRQAIVDELGEISKDLHRGRFFWETKP